MKRGFSIFVLLAMLVSISPNQILAQDINRQKVNDIIGSIKKKLPVKTANGGTIENIEIVNGYVVMTSSYMSIYDSNGKSRSRSRGESFIEIAKSQSSHQLYGEFANAGLGLKMVAFFKKQNSKEEITLSAKEILRMISYPAESYDYLLNSVREARKGLPIHVAQGISTTAIEFDIEELIYVNEVDEKLYSIDVMNSNLSNQKSNMLAQLSGGTSEMLPLVKMAISAGYGLTFDYIGKTSKKHAKMTLSYEELSKQVNSH